MSKPLICVLLPGRLDRPVGGHKVLYQRLNHIAAKGYPVVIANSVFIPSESAFFIEILRKIHAAVRYLWRKHSCRNWFPLHPSIVEKPVWSFHEKYMPRAGYYMASDATTAKYLREYPVDSSRLLYYIQGYETWIMSEEQLLDTYKIPCRKIVVAKWLHKIVSQYDRNCILISNGFDSTEFHCTIPIKAKNKFQVSMLYHMASIKNVKLGFEALEIVHKKVPALSVVLFGVYDEPASLPNYCTYYYKPDRNQHLAINNESAIYVGPSDTEGFGLTVLEAMACGQAVVCTDNPGYRETAEDGVNALVSKVGDAEALAANILRLIEDEALRISLAEKGLSISSEYSIERGNLLFEDLFN